MSKTQVEVVFGFIGEELAGTPIPCKPEVRPSKVQPGARIEIGRASQFDAIDDSQLDALRYGVAASGSRTYPIKRLRVQVRISEDFERNASQREVMTQVLKEMAYQLAAELVPLMKPERQPDYSTLSTVFTATLLVVDPSVKGDKITLPEAGPVIAY